MRQPEPDHGANRLVVAVLVFLGTVLVGVVSLPFIISSFDNDDEAIVETDPPPSSEPAIDSSQEPSSDSIDTPEPPSEPSAGAVAEIEEHSPEESTPLSGTLIEVEHCRMSLEVPGHWDSNGENLLGETIIANYALDGPAPEHGVVIELCPMREASLKSGEPFTFGAGLNGEIFYGGIYLAADPERMIDLLYSDNLGSVLLSARFEQPATDDNPATSEFFAVLDTVQLALDELPAQTEPAPEPPASDHGGVDPLFVTYACNERQSPNYNRAVEKWGYLTHGGKDLMCLEFLAGNNEFVSHHQELVEETEVVDASILIGHDNDPHSWYLNTLASANVNPFGDFGRFILESYPYEVIDLLMQAHTPSDETLTILHAASFVDGWSSWWMGQESEDSLEFLSTGALIAKTLNGDTGTHFSRRLDQAVGVEVEYQLIGALVESASIGRRNSASRQALLGSFEHSFLMFRSNAANNSTFHDWLLANPDVFLAHFWPNENWTPQNR